MEVDDYSTMGSVLTVGGDGGEVWYVVFTEFRGFI